MRWRAAAAGLALAGVVGLALAVAGPAEAQEPLAELPSPWHLDLDVAYAQHEVAFVSATDFVPLCAEPPCDVADFAAPLFRGAIAVAHAGFALEASLGVPLGLPDDRPLVVWSAGVRIDTGWDAFLSLMFRFAYVRRWGDLEGEGGRAGIGIQIRPVQAIAGYAEASIDATTVPTVMNDAGTLFSYSTFLGGGLRLSFGH